jgi:hypothetical protein
MAWKLIKAKVVEEGTEKEIEVPEVDESGNPIWIREDDKKEIGIDADHFFNKIPTLLDEKRQVKKEFTDFKNMYKDIDDPEEARKAIQMLRDGKLGENKINEVREQLKEEYNKSVTKIATEKDSIISNLNKEIYNLVVSNAFRSSPILNGSKKMTTIPVELAEIKWGKNFKSETVNGRPTVVGYLDDAHTQPIYSDSKPGEYAPFDEAFLKLLDKSPLKNEILKGSGASGGGNQSGDSFKLDASGSLKPMTSYKYLSDFSGEKEKSAFIEAYGISAYQKVVDNTRAKQRADRNKK